MEEIIQKDYFYKNVNIFFTMNPYKISLGISIYNWKCIKHLALSIHFLIFKFTISFKVI